MKANQAIKTVAAVLISAAAFAESRLAGAQASTPRLVETSQLGGLFSTQTPSLSYLGKDGTPTQRGVSVSETLRGNGSRAGYMLAHGGVIPDSVQVSVGASVLRAGADYYLDPASGALAFAQPVRTTDSVRVHYRYLEGQDSARSPLGLTGLGLNLRGASLNFGYAVSSANGFDFSTYGLSISSKLGGASSLSSLIYFSNPATSTKNRLNETTASLKAPTKADSSAAVSDHLIVQDLNLKTGSSTFRATYQDVGLKFGGFQALKQSAGGNADALAKVAALEKEKGIGRLGFGLTSGAAKSGSLGLDWDRISDGKGEILRQGMGFQSGGLQVHFGQQKIDPTFTRFNDLRDADHAQWAREKGVSRRDLSLALASGKASAFNFSQNAIQDASGSLSQQALGYTGKSLSFSLSNRSADEKFARINDLTDAEKTALALDIRRQFNPNAAATEVTAKDKEQIVKDAGLSRSRMSFSSLLGKSNNFAFNQFEIGDGKGKIDRRTFSFAGQGLSFNYLDQTIGDSFGRLGGLSDFEHTQFGNELGIHRTTMGLNLALSKSSTLAFTRLSLGDKAGAMSRQGIAYTAKGLELKYNLASTDKDFSRSKDLLGFSDSDKASIETERGFLRTDFTANLTSIKGLSLSTYLYDAKNAENEQARTAFRHSLTWTPNKALKVSVLSEANSFDKDGAIQDGRRHDLITLDDQVAKGVKLNLYRDTLDTTVAGTPKPTVTTEFVHVETDRNKVTNMLAETKRVDLGDGKHEDTTQLDLNCQPTKTMSLRYNKLEIDRGDDPSSDTDLIAWKWQMSRGVNFSGSYADTQTNNNADVTSTSFALDGPISKEMTVKGTYTEVDQHEKNVKAVSDVAISTTKPVSVLGFKAVTVTAKYASVNDQKKQQSDAVGGKIQGLLGKHQVALEYAGSLTPQGNAAIARTLSIVSDRSDKARLKFDLSYKARNVNRGDLQLVRKYNAAFKVARGTNVTYTFVSLPEDAAGNCQPVKSSAFALKRSIRKSIDLAVDYTTAFDGAKKTASRKLGAVLSGKLDAITAVEVGYSVDVDIQGSNRVDGQTIRLAYDHQLDGDHFITVSSQYTSYDGPQPDAVQANLDFKTRF